MYNMGKYMREIIPWGKRGVNKTELNPLVYEVVN